MSFCEKCGRKLADDEVCTCSVGEEKAPRGKGIGVPVLFAAIVIVLLLVVLAMGLLKREELNKAAQKAREEAEEAEAYKELMDDFVAQVNKKNSDPVELISTLMPEFGAKLYEKLHKEFMEVEGYADIYEYYVEDLEDVWDDCEDELGKWKLSFEESNVQMLDGNALEEVQDYLDDYYEDYLEAQVEELEELLEDVEEVEDLADDWDVSEEQVESVLKAYIKYMKAYEELEAMQGYIVEGKFVVDSKKEDSNHGGIVRVEINQEHIYIGEGAVEEEEQSTVRFYVVKINGDWTYGGIESGELLVEGDEEGCFNFLSRYLKSQMLYQELFY